MDTSNSAEIARLESNNTELLLHEETLTAQLKTKKEQLKQIRDALSDCKRVLSKHDEDEKKESDKVASDDLTVDNDVEMKEP